jgi:membrane protease subunit (stomatin/prohibitin family)
MFTAGDAIPEGFAPDVQNISTRLETITGLETKISDIKAAAEAGKAEKAAASAASGEKPASGRFCSSCGAPLTEGVMFCGSCGKKVE